MPNFEEAAAPMRYALCPPPRPVHTSHTSPTSHTPHTSHSTNVDAVACALSHLFTQATEAELEFMLASIEQGDAPTAARVAHGILGAMAFAVQPQSAQPLRLTTHIEAPPRPASAPMHPLLTSRELKVLWMIARGASNQQIADDTHRSIHTIEAQVKSIYRKLSVKSRTQAIREAMHQGLLTWQSGSDDGVSIVMVDAPADMPRAC
ncbi:LuxR C-terminal-related transcriptional regulator [Variovorax sp. H27-G14]